MRSFRTLAVSLSFLSLIGCGSQAVDEPTARAVGTQEQSATTVAVYHSTWNGGAASANAWTEAGGIGLSAWENQVGGTRHSFLSYSRSWTDASSFTCQTQQLCWWPPGSPNEICEDFSICGYTRRGWDYFGGEIPAGNFVANGAAARLDTDLSLATNYYFETCTNDEIAGTVICSNGPPSGKVNFTWKKNGQGASSGSGVNETRLGKYTWRSTGVFRNELANFSGTAFGTTFQGSGSIDRNRGSAVQRVMLAEP